MLREPNRHFSTALRPVIDVFLTAEEIAQALRWATARRVGLQVVISLGLFLFSVSLAKADDTAKVNAERFVQMSFDEQVLYTTGVLDAMGALYLEKQLPAEKAMCPRAMSHGELISGVNAYLYRALSSNDAAVKDAVRRMPVSVWIVREYWRRC